MSAETDRVVVTALVEVDPETAFTVFTDGIDTWWKHGQRFRTGREGESVMRLEPGAGGRLIEVFDEGGEPFVLGRITIWKPFERLAFEMGGRNFAPEEKTEVEVRFEAERSGTRVTLEHRGWDAFSEDHVARHGLQGGAFTSMLGVFWGDLLVRHRATCEGRI